jgi:hypothetical protein
MSFEEQHAAPGVLTAGSEAGATAKILRDIHQLGAKTTSLEQFLWDHGRPLPLSSPSVEWQSHQTANELIFKPVPSTDE